MEKSTRTCPIWRYEILHFRRMRTIIKDVRRSSHGRSFWTFLDGAEKKLFQIPISLVRIVHTLSTLIKGVSSGGSDWAIFQMLEGVSLAKTRPSAPSPCTGNNHRCLSYHRIGWLIARAFISFDFPLPKSSSSSSYCSSST